LLAFDFLIPALMLGLLGPAGGSTDFPAVAEVVVEALDVFNAADATSFTVRRLRRGDRVTVRDDAGAGWLLIEPPPRSFGWIDEAAIDGHEPGRIAVVTAERTVVRVGLEGARLPGPPGLELARGATVTLLDRPSAWLGNGRERTTWRAIEAPPGAVGYVRAEGVKRLDTPPEPVAETRAAYMPKEPENHVPPEVAAEIARIEAIHHAVLRESVERWRFEVVRQRYQDLLKRVSDTPSGNAIRARLAIVERHEAMGESARTIETLIDRSRRRDRQLTLVLRRLSESERPQSRPYDAIGLVQPSSRKVNGQKVLALIGPEGEAVAYLDVPAGLDASPMVARRVGVRGAVHFNEALRAKLISVRDMEPIQE
jgi:hypothetical protein